jgi:hypothetical protein
MAANLHDALLHSIYLRCAEVSTVILSVSYLASEDSRTRTRATITLSNVASMGSTIDLQRQATHAAFGNISDWKPSEGRGMSFIHLAGGTVSIYGDEPVLLDD